MTLFRNRVFADVIKVRIEMKSYWLSVSPKSNENHFIRHRKDTQRHKEEGHMMMKAEIRVMWSQDNKMSANTRSYKR